jgi:hypothetical protein
MSIYKINPIMLRLTALLLALMATTSAAAQSHQPVRLGPVSVVATSSPTFRLFPGVSVAWRDSAVHVYQDETVIPEPMAPIFREAIETAIQGRGYRLREAGEGSYEIGFVLDLASDMSGADIFAQLGFNPGLAEASSERFERGTLAIMLMRPDGNEIVWRGAIQAFADMEAGPESRRERIRLAAERLLRSLPEAPR